MTIESATAHSASEPYEGFWQKAGREGSLFLEAVEAVPAAAKKQLTEHPIETGAKFAGSMLLSGALAYASGSAGLRLAVQVAGIGLGVAAIADAPKQLMPTLGAFADNWHSSAHWQRNVATVQSNLSPYLFDTGISIAGSIAGGYSGRALYAKFRAPYMVQAEPPARLIEQAKPEANPVPSDNSAIARTAAEAKPLPAELPQAVQAIEAPKPVEAVSAEVVENHIPPLTKDGFLPPGEHPASWQEFEQRYATTPRRQVLIEGEETLLEELHHQGGNVAYEGGSLVTGKAEPGDWDATWRVSGEEIGRLLKEDPILADRAYQRTHFGGEMMATYPNSPGDGVLGFLKMNRAQQPVGVVKIDLNTLPPYEQFMKTHSLTDLISTAFAKADQ